MTPKTTTVRIAATLAALSGVALLGAYALQARQIEREIARLPVVQMDPVVVFASRTQASNPSTQVAKTPATTTLR